MAIITGLLALAALVSVICLIGRVDRLETRFYRSLRLQAQLRRETAEILMSMDVTLLEHEKTLERMGDL